jgi:hypothetical protein
MVKFLFKINQIQSITVLALIRCYRFDSDETYQLRCEVGQWEVPFVEKAFDSPDKEEFTILEIDYFSLGKHDGPYEKWPEKSMLFKNGKYTGHEVPGYIIERQFLFDEFYFLVTSYDCIFEEECSFVLLDKDYKVIAKKNLIPWYYASWSLDSHTYLGNSEFTFTFYKDYPLKVSLFPHRKGWLARRIVIHKPKSGIYNALCHHYHRRFSSKDHVSRCESLSVIVYCLY